MKKLFKTITVVFLISIILTLFTACAPSTVKEAETKLKNKGYSVIYAYETNENGMLGAINATKVKKGNANTIKAFLYKNSATANKVKNNYKNLTSSTEKLIIAGSWVIIATDGAYEDFIS